MNGVKIDHPQELEQKCQRKKLIIIHWNQRKILQSLIGNSHLLYFQYLDENN